MTRPIRPVITVVLRLWREPGVQEGDAAWRGMIRPLGGPATSTSEFHGLENTPHALRRLLEDRDTPAATGHPVTDQDVPTDL
jgi:hypothetical protein